MNKKQIDIKKIIKVNKLGLNKHFGKDNPRWNNGNRLKGNFPCPECGNNRICEKRDVLEYV